jgi:hypothetical protein
MAYTVELYPNRYIVWVLDNYLPFIRLLQCQLLNNAILTLLLLLIFSLLMLRFISVLFSITILWSSSICTFAQDIIIKKDGEELKTKVVEVSDTLIKYKKFDDPEFFTFIIAKKDVKSIKYENGKTVNPNKRSKETYLELRSALVLPFGNYGSSDLKKNNPGLAKAGFGSCLAFGFKVSKKLGLSLNLGSFYNNYNSEALDDQLKGQLGQGEIVTTSYTRYEGKYLLVGLQYHIPVSKKITWVSKLSAGVMGFSKPEFHYNYVDSTVATSPMQFDYYSTSGHAVNGAFGLGTSLWFKLSNRFTLTGNVDVMVSRQKVYYNIHSYSTQGNNMNSATDYSKVVPVSVFNAGVGMIFYLRKKR